MINKPSKKFVMEQSYIDMENDNFPLLPQRSLIGSQVNTNIDSENEKLGEEIGRFDDSTFQEILQVVENGNFTQNNQSSSYLPKKSTNFLLQSKQVTELLALCQPIQELELIKQATQRQLDGFERETKAFYNEFLLFFQETIKKKYPKLNIESIPQPPHPSSFFDPNLEFTDLIEYVKRVLEEIHSQYG